MTTTIVFETHAITEDNEAGRATGWFPGRLAPAGRAAASELGARRAADGIDAVFTSDLGRALETVEIAFGATALPVLHDWRLRECDYGDRNGTPAAELHEDRSRYLDEPHPRGESWRQAVHRVSGVLRDLPTRWDGQRVLVIGHVATRWALDHILHGVALEHLIHADFAWREGWEYRTRLP